MCIYEWYGKRSEIVQGNERTKERRKVEIVGDMGKYMVDLHKSILSDPSVMYNKFTETLDVIFKN